MQIIEQYKCNSTLTKGLKLWILIISNCDQTNKEIRIAMYSIKTKKNTEASIQNFKEKEEAK